MRALRFGIGLAIVFAASYAAAQVGADKRRSGTQDMGEALQKMQEDDTANPGMLFVQLGSQSWAKKAGVADKSCADCHGNAGASMKGVAARYPAIPKDAEAVIVSTGLMGGKAIDMKFDKPCSGPDCAESGDFLQGRRQNIPFRPHNLPTSLGWIWQEI